MGAYDISRVSFDPRKHYSSVRMQQGKVLLDDDFNESRRMDEEIERRVNADVIGGYGSPDEGFKIVNWDPAGPVVAFDIHNGSIYIGGLRWEMEKVAANENPSRFERFRRQKDWLQKPEAEDQFPTVAEIPDGASRFDLVYLQAWQQPVSAVEDGELLEMALGGPDTTTRVRKMRRVHIYKDAGSAECAEAWQTLKEEWKTNRLGYINRQYERIPNTQLSVSFVQQGIADDLCSPNIAGGYLGAENQAIRVQLTRPGFLTWGFDNASPLYRVTVTNRQTVTMITTPKDQYHWPLAGQTVEIIAASALLSNGEKVAEQSGHLAKVSASYNPDTKQLTLATNLPNNFGLEHGAPTPYFFMRVWNRGNDLLSNAEIAFITGTPLTLGNTGLQVTISPKDIARPADQVPEDYWVIAARPKTPNTVVPWQLETGISPHGPRRFFAPLAIIQWTNAAGVITGEILHDCRKKFRPLTEQECCCTYTVGDGVRSKGDFNSIQEAIDHLPGQGGKICVLAGIHEANVLIRQLAHIEIIGCGDQSIVRAAEQRAAEPVFRIEHSQWISIKNLTIISIDGTGIEAEDSDENKEASNEIRIHENAILAFVHAVSVNLLDMAGDNNIRITYNRIGMFERQLRNDNRTGDVAIFCKADDVLIERNRIVILHVRPGGDPEQPEDEDNPPGDVNDPCADVKKIYRNVTRFRVMVKSYLKFVTTYRPSGRNRIYRSPGGIQIGCSSEKVWILENEIIGGSGTGILLGHFEQPEGEVFEIHFAPITNIRIEGNNIQQMGTAGIGPFLQLKDGLVFARIVTKQITIYRNHIFDCALQLPDLIMEEQIAFGGVVLVFCEEGVIQENRIEENGISHIYPICGIFVFHGEQMDISNNRVVNNGPRTNAPDNTAKNGFRAGIMIRMAYKPSTLPAHHESINNFGLNTRNEIILPIYDASPAVKVHDNIVLQPLGHALFIMAFGPVSVVSNQFTSQGIVAGDKFSVLAGALFIFNLGLSKDLINLIWGSNASLKQLPYNNPSTLAALMLTRNPKTAAAYLRLQLFPSGRTMVSANQTTLDLTSHNQSICISAQTIVALDDINFTSNQTECASLAAWLPGTGNFTMDFVLVNTMLLGLSIRSNDNRFTEGFTFSNLSLISFGFMNTTANNQLTHCYLALGFPTLLVEDNNRVLISLHCQDKTKKVGAFYGKAVRPQTVRARP